MFGVLDRFESVGIGCTQDTTGTSGIGQKKIPNSSENWNMYMYI